MLEKWILHFVYIRKCQKKTDLPPAGWLRELGRTYGKPLRLCGTLIGTNEQISGRAAPLCPHCSMHWSQREPDNRMLFL